MKQEQQHKDLMRRAVRHLLVTDDDVMTEAERIVGNTLQRENQGDNGCLTVTEIARELDMEARDLNSFLRDMVSNGGSKVSIGSLPNMRDGG